MPLLEKGTYNTLNEEDVWALSPTLQSRAIFQRFSTLKRKTLLRRIWAANSLDIVLDFSLSALYLIPPFFSLRTHAKRHLTRVYVSKFD